MRLPELIPARLLRRYKRFLADVEFADGSRLTVHCPNTGAMTGCALPGSRVWLSVSENPARKYPHSWELVDTPTGMACIHSARANEVVTEALAAAVIPGFSDYTEVRREVAYAPGHRADIVLAGDAGRVVIEVKSVTLCRDNGWGAFPDAVSERGRRHINTLAAALAPDTRCLLLFCAMHSGVRQVCTAGDIDTAYRDSLARAIDAGLEVQAWGCSVAPDSIAVSHPLPFALDAPASL